MPNPSEYIFTRINQMQEDIPGDHYELIVGYTNYDEVTIKASRDYPVDWYYYDLNDGTGDGEARAQAIIDQLWKEGYQPEVTEKPNPGGSPRPKTAVYAYVGLKSKTAVQPPRDNGVQEQPPMPPNENFGKPKGKGCSVMLLAIIAVAVWFLT